MNRETQPTFEGRSLPKPDEPVQDQGLQFDLETLHRRRFLGLLGGGIGALALSACGVSSQASTSSSAATTSTSSTTSSSATAAATTATSATASTLTEIPDETAGPYPGDGSNGPEVLTQSGVVRSDIRSSFGSASGKATGVALTFTLTVLDMANGGVPMVGAAVYAWHCDAAGNYSMYSSGITNENYLRGVQVTGTDGSVTFTSIFPGCYAGRWPHIHFEVYPDVASITDASKAIATSQLALPQATCAQVYATSGYASSVTNLAAITLATDNVFGDDSGIHQLATVTGTVSSGFAAALNVPVDTRTTPSAGSAPGRP